MRIILALVLALPLCGCQFIFVQVEQGSENRNSSPEAVGGWLGSFARIGCTKSGLALCVSTQPELNLCDRRRIAQSLLQNRS
jgi:hypothetical protein